MAVIGPDLQNAIEQLRAVPSLNAWTSRPADTISSLGNQSQQSASGAVGQDEQTTAVQTAVQGVSDIVAGSVVSDGNADVRAFETTRYDDVTGSDSAADDSADDRSKYTMSWNIRKMHKHRLDPTGYRNDETTGINVSHDLTGLTSRNQKLSSLSSASCDQGSSESIDSVVERILETTDNASEETAQHRSAFKSGTETRDESEINDKPNVANTVNVTLDVNRRHVTVNCDQPQTIVEERERSAKYSAPKTVGSWGLTNVVTLEDLFEQAVESLDSANDDEDNDVINRSTAEPLPRAKQYRGEENVERRVYDDDLHRQCHEYRLHGYSFVQDEQYSRLSRGFAHVEKVDRTTASVKRRAEDKTDHGVESASNDNNIGQILSHTATSDFVPGSMKKGSKSASEVESRTTYRQRTVISASLAPSGGQSRRNDEDGTEDYVRKLDLGLDCEMAANSVPGPGQQSGMSRSSSITWDTISVDSLVMVDDDSTSVRAVYSATTSTTRQGHKVDDVLADDEDPNQKMLKNDIELGLSTENGMSRQNFPHSSTCVADQAATETNEQKYQRSLVARTAAEISTALTPANIESGKNSVNIHSGDNNAVVTRSPQKDASTSVNIHQPANDVKILADSLTTQTLVLNVKLPKTVWNKSSARSKSAPLSCRRSPGGAPYRELRIHREIRLSDVEQTNSSDVPFITSGVGQLTSSSAVECNDVHQVKNDASSDDVITNGAVDDNAVIVFTSLRPSDVMTSLPFETEVKYENREMTSGTELLPYRGATDVNVQLVGVERTDAVRELVVKGRHSSDFRYEPASLRALVDNVKEALTAGGTITSLAEVVGITCEAVESRSVNSRSTPTTVINDTLIDCLAV